MTPRTIPVDWQAFAAHVERLRHEHATRSPDEGVRRTLTAWANSGTQPPESFFRCNPGARAVWRELLDNREESPLWTC
jgi:hypothetical protein